MKLDLRQMVFYALLFFLLGMLSIPINALAFWMAADALGGSMFFFWLLILTPPLVYYILLLKVIKYCQKTFSPWKPIYIIPILIASVMITAMPHFLFVAMF